MGLLNAKQACEQLHISSHTLYKYTSARTISTVKLGNRIFFTQKIIDDFIREKTIESIK